MRDINGRRVGIVGLGLIGGSLARDLTARRAWVAGHDADPESVRRALSEQVIREALDWSPGVTWELDLLVIAVPVSAAGDVLRAALPHLPPDCMITDVCSTKQSVLAHAESIPIGHRFVGSHPLAGDHRSGWSASRTRLFDGVRVFLCPTSESSAEAVESVRSLWESLGAETEMLGALEHDRKLAWSSHLPQLVSTLTALTLAESEIPRTALGPGGRDVSRLAGSSPEMWAGICADNAEALETALDALQRRIDDFRSALAEGDEAKLHRLLSSARDWAAEAE